MVRVAAPDEAILLLEIQVPCVLCARPQSVASLPRALDWGVARPASSAFPDSRTAQSSRLTSTGAKGCSGGWAEHPAGRTCASGWAVALGKPGGGASSSQGMRPSHFCAKAAVVQGQDHAVPSWTRLPPVHSGEPPAPAERTSGRWQRFRLESFNESTSYTHNYKRIRIDKNIFFP